MLMQGPTVSHPSEAAGSHLQPLLAHGKQPDLYLSSDESEDEDMVEVHSQCVDVHKDHAQPTGADLPADVSRVYSAKSKGVVYIVGRSTVYARPGSSWARRFLLEGVFNFLVNNCRGWAVAQKIPRLQLIEVGMVSEI